MPIWTDIRLRVSCTKGDVGERDCIPGSGSPVIQLDLREVASPVEERFGNRHAVNPRHVYVRQVESKGDAACGQVIQTGRDDLYVIPFRAYVHYLAGDKAGWEVR